MFHFPFRTVNASLCFIRFSMRVYPAETWRAQMQDCESILVLFIYYYNREIADRFRVSRDAVCHLTCRQQRIEPVKVWRSNLFAVRTSRSGDDDFPFRWRSRRSLGTLGTSMDDQVAAERSTWSEKAAGTRSISSGLHSRVQFAQIRFEIAKKKKTPNGNVDLITTSWSRPFGRGEIQYVTTKCIGAFRGVRPLRMRFRKVQRYASGGVVVANKETCRGIVRKSTLVVYGRSYFVFGSLVCYNALLHICVGSNVVSLCKDWNKPEYCKLYFRTEFCYTYKWYS